MTLAFTGNCLLCHSQNALKPVLVRSSILENYAVSLGKKFLTFRMFVFKVHQSTEQRIKKSKKEVSCCTA